MDIGQRVICVDDKPIGASWHPLIKVPVKGCVYTIRGIHKQKHVQAIVLEEIVTPLMRDPWTSELFEPHFALWRFRPVRDTNIDVFRALLEPSGTQPLQPVKEDA